MQADAKAAEKDYLTCCLDGAQEGHGSWLHCRRNEKIYNLFVL